MSFNTMHQEHLRRIQNKLNKAGNELIYRGEVHDQDKTENKTVNKAYEEHFAKLKEIEFGTEQYKQYELDHFNKAHEIHAQNRHHFYSHRNNIDDINLLDMIEAIVDISESSKQYGNGDYIESMRSKGLFDYSLEELIINTIKHLEDDN